MAQADTIRFGKAFILLSNMVLPTPTFTAPCGFESLALNINIATSDVNIPDCDDPDLAAWLATDVVSKQMSLTGSGVLDTGAMQVWQDWWLNDLPEPEVDVRFFRDLSQAKGGGYFQAPGVLTSYGESGQRGQRWQNSVTINLNGKPVWVPAA
jgi:hypothetical protein